MTSPAFLSPASSGAALTEAQEALCAELRAFAARGCDHGDPIAVFTNTTITRAAFLANFGCWGDFERAAGLLPPVDPRRRVPDGELLADIQRVARALGRMPRRGEYARYRRYGLATMRRRFGNSWARIGRAYHEWTALGRPPHLTVLKATRSTRPVAAIPPTPVPQPSSPTRPILSLAPSTDRPQTVPVAPSGKPGEEEREETEGWEPEAGAPEAPCLPRQRPVRVAEPQGGPLDHPVLRSVPTTESEILILLGAEAKRLGIVIERASPSFPDLIVRRRVGNRWVTRHWEIELNSKRFKEHDAEAELADGIVCWTHDWKSCPHLARPGFEVVELSSLLGFPDPA